MIEKILGFMKDAGALAVKMQDGIDLTGKYVFKEGHVGSVVTETDLKISEMFKEFVEKNFSDLDYVIVDEESLDDLGDKPYEKIMKAPFAFVLDPIDGTLPYSLKMPEWGVIVGVLKYGKPYIGAVYVPVNKEAIYFDGSKAHWLEHAFLSDERKTELIKGNANPRAFVASSNHLVATNEKHNHRKDIDLDLYAAAVYLLYVATGRARAYYVGVHPWDIAGGWAVFRHLGIEFRNMKTGAVLEEISDKYFNEKWKMKDVHVACRFDDFKHFQEIVDLRR